MTEIDAAHMALFDAKRMQKRLNQGAMPQQISEMMTKLIRRRISDMDEPRASAVVEELIQRGPPSASTFSEQLVQYARQLITSAMRFLPPEDTRALLLWIAGPSPHPGLISYIIQMIGESSGPTEVAKFQEETKKIISKMRSVDMELFKEKIGELNIARRNIIHGMLLDAQWSTKDGDGHTARNHIVQARKLALLWLNQKEQRRRAGWN